MGKSKESKKVTISRFLYIFLIVVIIVLIIIIALFIARTFTQYHTFKNHENYFKQPNVEIQPWMNIEIIENRFNITQESLSKELDINASKISPKSTLDSICRKNHLNCNDVVNELNNIKK